MEYYIIKNENSEEIVKKTIEIKKTNRRRKLSSSSDENAIFCPCVSI